MKKIKIGVVGLGNLGRACIEIIKERKNEFQLIAVFSRREVSGCISLAQINEYKDKIDVLLVCVGSQADAPILVPQLAQNFNTVDSFDNHAEIPLYIERINENQDNTTAIVATGWDPGLFSIVRIYFDAFIGGTAESFYGKGVSLGHTNAVRAIQGVQDAIQFTIPKSEAVTKVRKGQQVDCLEKHKRLCYVVCEHDSPEERKRIENEIKSMKNYFENQEVEIIFISKKDFDKRYKNKVSHGGMVLSGDGKSTIELKLKLKSNPRFTAQVMIAYAIANYNLQQQDRSGVFTVADIEPALLTNCNYLQKI